jgi:HEAT repeat protein
MAENQWYILIGQERQGPMSVQDVRYLVTRRNIDGGTLVWQEGMESWVRLREVEAFQPKKKDEEESAEAEKPEAAKSDKAPPPVAQSATVQRLLKLIPMALAFALVGGALYVFLSDEPSDSPIAEKARTPAKRAARTPEDLVKQLKRGDTSARDRLVQGGSRSVPALIQALLEKGSPLHPTEVRAILIEIGPSSASVIGDALEGIGLSKVAQIILVEVLGQFGGLSSVPSLIVALGNPDVDVQQHAIEAISKLDPAVGPALARHLTSPIQELSKVQKKNLADALGQHGSPESIPIIQQAQRSERDAEVISALAKAVEQISRNPRTDAPTPIVQVTLTPQSNQEKRESPPPQNISVSVSASATATATAESPDKEPTEEEEEAPPNDENEQKAKALAEEGDRLREEGKDEEALAKYKEAYALYPIRIYLLVILSMEGLDEFSASAKADSIVPPPPLPEIEAPEDVTLADIYSEMDMPEPDLSRFSGDLGSWSGTPDAEADVTRDGNLDLYLIRGSSGQDFLAAVRRREFTVNRTTKKTWRGTLQGFRFILDGKDSRMLPVLNIDKTE